MCGITEAGVRLPRDDERIIINILRAKRFFASSQERTAAFGVVALFRKKAEVCSVLRCRSGQEWLVALLQEREVDC